ncbi:MAG: peptide deformylase [Chlorobi bacterium]|nr:peptide deformylase [Chlorobiota bacterium]
MAILPIYNSFHPIMQKKAEDVTEFDADLMKTIDDMFETMYNADGIGLAGNQIGLAKKIVVIDPASGNEGKTPQPFVMINPEIISSSEEEVDYQEGCLSVPQFYEKVVRPVSIEVKYFDKNMVEHKEEVDGILARVMQHEIDHLNGKVFYERLSSLRRTLAKNKLKRINRGNFEVDYPMIHSDGKPMK